MRSNIVSSSNQSCDQPDRQAYFLCNERSHDLMALAAHFGNYCLFRFEPENSTLLALVTAKILPVKGLPKPVPLWTSQAMTRVLKPAINHRIVDLIRHNRGRSLSGRFEIGFDQDISQAMINYVTQLWENGLEFDDESSRFLLETMSIMDESGGIASMPFDLSSLTEMQELPQPPASKSQHFVMA